MKIIYSPTICRASSYQQSFVQFMTQNFSREVLEEEPKTNLLYSEQGFFIEENNEILFYSGYLLTIMKNYRQEEIKIKSTISKYKSKTPQLPDLLYKHQKKILNSIFKRKRGLVQSPTGSGKSFVISECVKQFYNEGMPIIITVPTIDLLNQLKSDILSYAALVNFELVESDIGLIGGGNFDTDLSYKIHIAIPQSLCKLKKTKKLLNKCQVLIADEVHTTATPTYGSIIDECINTQIRIGLSATPWTNQNNHKLLHGFFGNIICSVTESDMISDGVIMEPHFLFYTSPKGFVPKKIGEFAANIGNLSTGHRYKILNQVYNYLILNNNGRNKKIVELAIQRSTPDLGPVIIIVNKVNDIGKKVGHATILKTMFEAKGKEVSVISGSIKKKDRVSIIEDLKNSNIDIVIAGPKVLTAGVNIPSLSTAILAGAGKSDSDLIQRIGRLLRKKQGKERPLVIDFMDTQFWFENQSYTRMNVIKSVYGDKNINVI